MGRSLEESSGLTPAAWHTRYQLQAGWTAEIRKYCYQRASILDARRILEVGCGSGVICDSLHAVTRADIVGIDIDPIILKMAHDLDKPTGYINGDALELPLKTGIFDATLCHYFLLWMKNPLKTLAEMVRVTRKGGTVMALAEPDYGGRIDHPPELVVLGISQAESLKRQGADPLAGRKLAGWFHQVGLKDIECGILGSQWKKTAKESLINSEWKFLQHDLAGSLNSGQQKRLRKIDEQAWVDGSRVLFLPTFYALGWVR